MHRAAALEAVEDDEQLHDVFVDGMAGRLHHKYITATHILIDAGQELAVGKILEVDAAERVAEAMGDAFREARVGPAAEDLE